MRFCFSSNTHFADADSFDFFADGIGRFPPHIAKTATFPRRPGVNLLVDWFWSSCVEIVEIVELVLLKPTLNNNTENKKR